MTPPDKPALPRPHLSQAEPDALSRRRQLPVFDPLRFGIEAVADRMTG